MRTGAPLDALRSLKPGQRVYIQGGPGECALLYRLMRDNPALVNGVELWSCLIPGINTLDYGSLPGDVRLATFMASPALEPSIASGRTRVMAMPYSGIGETLSAMEFDVAILHAAPADTKGWHSFSIASDVPSIVWPRSGRKIVLANERMPALSRAEGIHADAVDMVVPIDEPLIAPTPAKHRSPALDAIAQQVAQLVPDNATIQAGIGDTPAAAMDALRLHRGLRVHSGIVSQEYRQLAEAGALDAGAEHVTGVAWGDVDFHQWLADSGFVFRPVSETHGAAVLAAIPNFVSIGSALEIDLAGNLNLEWRAGRRISSVGGAPDYMRGAAASRGGRSIIALQATGGNGASRIVPALKSPSIAGDLADVIVTEHGVAHLRGLSDRARADALIAIAAPEQRAFLDAAR